MRIAGPARRQVLAVGDRKAGIEMMRAITPGTARAGDEVAVCGKEAADLALHRAMPHTDHKAFTCYASRTMLHAGAPPDSCLIFQADHMAQAQRRRSGRSAMRLGHADIPLPDGV
jgi:hypothetical protein